MNRATFATLLLLVCAWQVGCRCSGEDDKTPPPPGTSRFRLHSVHWRMNSDTGDKISREQFRKLASEALRSVKLKRLEVKRATLKGELGLRENKGVLVLEATVRMTNLAFPIETTLLATSQLATGESAEKLIRKGLSDLSAALTELLRVAEGKPAAWARGLQSSEMDVQILAARLLGEAKRKDAIGVLSELLSDPRERVAEAAADALAEIGDKKAVPLIIQSIKRGALRSEVRAIETIGKLGGEEAEAYLEMTAVGHELDEVRLLSGNLLKELRKVRVK